MQDYFNAIVRAENEAARYEALQDWLREMSGANAGRIARFGVDDDRDSGSGGSRGKDKRDAVSDLIDLLPLPDYAALHGALMDGFQETRRRAVNLEMRLDRLISQAEAQREDVLGRAARLPDGTQVFRNAAGDVVLLDGTPVDPVLADTILWHGTEPRLEEAQQAVELADRANALRDRSNGVLFDIDEAIGELNDTKDGGLEEDGFEVLEESQSNINGELDALADDVDALTREMTFSATGLAPTTETSFDIPELD